MVKINKTEDQAPEKLTKQKKKENRKMKQTTLIEKIKTIALTALITGIIAFIGGVVYQSNANDQMHEQAKSLAASVKAEQLKQ